MNWGLRWDCTAAEQTGEVFRGLLDVTAPASGDITSYARMKNDNAASTRVRQQVYCPRKCRQVAGETGCDV